MRIIATDEAGYGPNLGPLVVSGTSWHCDVPDCLENFANELRSVGFGFGDSKKVYHAGGSIAALETVALGALISLRGDIKTVRQLFRSTTAKDLRDPFLSKRSTSLPIAADAEKVRMVAERFLSAPKRFGIVFENVQSAIVFPEEFNRLLEHYDSKGSMLSELTMQIVKTLDLDDKNDLRILCDKHGGRNRYLDLLQGTYPGEMIWVDHESRSSSVYRFSQGKRSVEARFIAKGESETAVALSSMISKYQRELVMLEFNAFWRERIPGLRPTAGYPEDAKRFKKDIESMQCKLEISEDVLWRKK